jgi:hypothetical protein
MKKILFLFLSLAMLSSSLNSCKALARTAAKYWTKKQIKEFVQNCETKSAKLLGEDKAAQVCDCAVDKVAVQYKNYEDAKTVSIAELLKIANECR